MLWGTEELSLWRVDVPRGIGFGFLFGAWVVSLGLLRPWRL
jgi:hypothetical protein